MDKRRILFPILFLIFAFLGNSVSSIFLFIAFGIAIITIMTSRIEESFCFSFFLIPNIRILDGMGASFFVNILVVLPIFKYLFLNNWKLSRITWLGTFLFLIIEGTHIALLNYFNNAPSEMCWLLAFILCSSIICDEKICITKANIVYYFSIGIVGTAIVYMMCNLDYTRNIIDEVIDGSRFKAYADDPNFYSLYICLTISMIMSIHNKDRKYFFIIAILSCIGFLTASKMCFLMMCFVIFSTVLIQIMSYKTENKDHKFVFKLLALIAVAIVLLNELVVKLITNLLSRAGILGSSSIDIAKVTTGRSTIFDNYIDILSSNIIALIFGYGFVYSNYIGEENGHGAHNTYLDFILSWGIVGSIILVYIVVSLYKDYTLKNREKLGLIEHLPIIVLLLNFADLGCLSATMFWFVLSAAIISSRRELDGDECEKYVRYDKRNRSGI